MKARSPSLLLSCSRANCNATAVAAGRVDNPAALHDAAAALIHEYASLGELAAIARWPIRVVEYEALQRQRQRRRRRRRRRRQLRLLNVEDSSSGQSDVTDDPLRCLRASPSPPPPHLSPHLHTQPPTTTASGDPPRVGAATRRLGARRAEGAGNRRPSPPVPEKTLGEDLRRAMANFDDVEALFAERARAASPVGGAAAVARCLHRMLLADGPVSFGDCHPGAGGGSLGNGNGTGTGALGILSCADYNPPKEVVG